MHLSDAVLESVMVFRLGADNKPVFVGTTLYPAAAVWGGAIFCLISQFSTPAITPKIFQTIKMGPVFSFFGKKSFLLICCSLFYGIFIFLRCDDFIFIYFSS